MSDFEHENSSGLRGRLALYEQRRAALKRLGMPATLEDVAERMGSTKSTVARILSGERKRIGYEEEIQLARALDQMEADARRIYGPDALSPTAESVAEPARRPAASPRLDLPAALNPVRMPVYGLASAGSAAHLDHDSVVDWLSLEDIFGAGTPGREPFLLEVAGVSMEPRYMHGERVIVQRNRPPRPGEDAVFEFTDGHAELKIYRGRSGGRIWYDQWNQDAPGFDPAGASFDAGQIKALHAVLRL